VKMRMSQNRKTKRDERGFITFDFIFALMLALGFTVALFALTVSLSTVEVAQYITFAVSRAYVGAHESDKEQEQLAQAKYNELLAYPVFKAAFNGGWFKIGPVRLGDFSKEYPEKSTDNAIFVGARLPMDARLLRMSIPFMGRTNDKTGTGKATLNSYLMREVSNTECRENFNRARWEHLKNMSVYKGVANAQAKLVTDNGC
jgi:hypothetical protein